MVRGLCGFPLHITTLIISMSLILFLIKIITLYGFPYAVEKNLKDMVAINITIIKKER